MLLETSLCTGTSHALGVRERVLVHLLTFRHRGTASAVPEARTHRTPIGGGIACWLPASSIDPLCGRDDVGRMVREPCRGPASSLSATPDEVPRRWRVEASPSVSSSVRGRGEDRDMVSLIASQASWLSQAIWVVNLRLPLDRRTIARSGARSPLARREHFNVRSKYSCVRNSVAFLSHRIQQDRSCGPLSSSKFF